MKFEFPLLIAVSVVLLVSSCKKSDPFPRNINWLCQMGRNLYKHRQRHLYFSLSFQSGGAFGTG